MAKQTSKLKYPLVLIEWEDSAFGAVGWKEVKEQTSESHIITSVGYVTNHNRINVMVFPHISNTYPENPSGGGDITIPKSAIRKIVSLHLGKRIKVFSSV